MNYYPHHIGDFNNATRHLTRVERALYRDAIELYYDTEQPLNGDDFDRLAKRLLANSDEERSALRDVLNEFFTLDGGCYHHARCDEEIAKYRANAEKKSKAGKASAAARQHKETDVEHVLNKCATNQEPRTKNQEPLKTKADKPPRFDAVSIELPNCIREDVWFQWIDYRRGRALTCNEKTIKAQIGNLVKWHGEGADPAKIIADSISNGWQGLFEPKQGNGGKSNADRIASTIAEFTGRRGEPAVEGVSSSRSGRTYEGSGVVVE